MKVKIKEAVILAVIQIVLYSLICVNYRAIALLHYHEAALADFLIASMNFFVIRKIAQSGDAFHQWIGYVVGSVIGSYSGIYLSVIINS
jgi:hypothetical protein